MKIRFRSRINNNPAGCERNDRFGRFEDGVKIITVKQRYSPVYGAGFLEMQPDGTVVNRVRWNVGVLSHNFCVVLFCGGIDFRKNRPAFREKRQAVRHKDRYPGELHTPIIFVQAGGQRRYAYFSVFQRFPEKLRIVPGIQKIVDRILIQPAPCKTLNAGPQFQKIVRVGTIQFLKFQKRRGALINFVPDLENGMFLRRQSNTAIPASLQPHMQTPGGRCRINLQSSQQGWIFRFRVVALYRNDPSQIKLSGNGKKVFRETDRRKSKNSKKKSNDPSSFHDNPQTVNFIN